MPMFWPIAGTQGPQGPTGATGAAGANGTGYLATSATSLATAGSGSKVFTTQSGLAYSTGARIRATSRGTGEWMEGVTTSYSGTTLTVAMDLNAGTGTHADWDINVAGQPGASGGAGSFVFLGEVVANNTSPNLDFTSLITAAYQDYQVEIVGLAIAGAANAIDLQFSANNGSSFDSTVGHYYWWDNVQVPGGPGVAGNASANAIRLFQGNSSSAGASISCECKLYGPLDSTKFVTVSGFASGFDSLVSDPRGMGQWTGGYYNQLVAVNAFRLTTSGAANFVSGLVRVYGIKNS